MSFGRALDKFAEGFKSGVELADRHSYNKAATDRIRKPTESEVETETTPLEDGGGGTVTKSPSTSGGTTKTETTKPADSKTNKPADDTNKNKIDDGSGSDAVAGGTGTNTTTGSAGSDTLADGGDVNGELVRRRRGIQSIESNGNYQILGPVTKDGDRAYGAYQIMGKNIPSWTKAALGRSMTPEEFLKDEKAQDAVFDHHFDGYVRQYGLEGAAQAWLGGPGSVGKKHGPADQLGTSTNVYGRRFMDAYNGKGGASKLAGAGKTGTAGGDTLVDSGPVAGTRPDAGVIPDFMSGDSSGGDGGGDGGSASLMIQAPEVNTATPGYSGLPEFNTDWANVGFAEGGAIPDETKGDSSFGWGSILGKNLLEGQGNAMTGGTPSASSPMAGAGQSLWNAGSAMLGPQAGFAKAAPAANLGAGAPSAAAGYSRDAADSAAAATGPAHWQPNAPANDPYAAQQAAYNAQVTADAQQAASAAAAQQAQIDATARAKAVRDKAIADAAAKKKAAQLAAAAAAKKKVKKPVLQVDQGATLSAAAPDVQAIGGGGGTDPRIQQLMAHDYAVQHGGASMPMLNMDREALKKRPEDRTPLEKARLYHFGYEEGGAIPEPGTTSFKKGGKVQEPSAVDDDGYFTRRKATNRDERFKQLLAEEERGGGRGGASGNARDRAARRLSVEEGRAPSTAYRPGGGGARREAAPARSGETRVKLPDKTDVVPTPRPDTVNDIVPVAAGTPTQGYDPKFSPDLAVSPPHERWPGQTTDGTPPPIAAGTPTQGYDTPAIPEPDETETTANPPPPQDTGVVQGKPAPDITGGGVDRTQDAVDAQRAREQAQRDRVDASIAEKEKLRVKFPNAKWPPSPTPPRAAGTPTGSYEPTNALYNDPKNQAAWIKAASEQLKGGRDPKEIAATLTQLGLSRDLWPLELQNAVAGFEKGGAIPDPEESSGSMFAGIDNEAAAEGRTEKLQPTPKLMGHVAQAAHGGLQFLKQTFGMGGGDGALPTPDDGAMREGGARRMASGEGAATDQEIASADQAIDPGGRLATHDKTMLRMAKTYQWYLEQGRKDEADAVAASLLQFGAQRTQHLGSIAAAAYSKFQQSGDQKDLDAAAGAIEEAYKYIPNGGDANISIGPNGSLQVQHTDADGNTENVDIKPNEISGLLKSAMDGSYYWGEIAKVADPKGYESKLTSERQAADDARSRREWDRQHGVTREEKTADEQAQADRTQKEWDRQHGIERTEKEVDAKTAAQAELDKEKRANVEEERRKLRDVALEEAKTAAKGAEPKSDAAALPGALSDASKAKVNYDADQTPENKQALDAAVTKLFKAYGFDAAKVESLGYDMTNTDMSAEGAPFEGAEQRVNPDTNKPQWGRVNPDTGKWQWAEEAPSS